MAEVGKPKGVNVSIAAPLVGVITFLIMLASLKSMDWQVNSTVPGMAVNGAVGGVKLSVYTAVPRTILKLLI